MNSPVEVRFNRLKPAKTLPAFLRAGVFYLAKFCQRTGDLAKRQIVSFVFFNQVEPCPPMSRFSGVVQQSSERFRFVFLKQCAAVTK